MSGAACVAARNARPSSTRCSRPARPGPSVRGPGPATRNPIRIRLCFERDLDRVKHSRPVAAARREVPGLHRAGRRSPPHAADARGRGRADRHRDRTRRRALRAARRGDRARARLRSRPGRPRVARRRSRRTFPAATTTRSTAPTSRSRRSTSAPRRSTACATIRGAGPRRRRPRARSSPGPIASPTSATTSRTRVRAGILVPEDLPEAVSAVVGHTRSRQIGAFVHAVLDAIDRTGHVGMTEPAASALARVPGLQLRPHLPAAGGPGRRPRRWSACCEAWSTSSSTRPVRLPADSTGMHSGFAPVRSKRRRWRCAT